MVSSSLDKFCEKISSDVDAEITAIISQAKEKAERKIKKANEQAVSASDKIIKDAKDRVKKMANRRKSENSSALRKEELKLEGKVREYVFSEIEKIIKVLREDSKKYTQVLFNLTLEAVLFFKEKEVELIANESDKNILNAAFISKITTEAATSGVEVKITLSNQHHKLCGIILKAGNVLWENTIEKRLAIFADGVDKIIITEILEKIRS